MSPKDTVDLLRALQEREVRRLEGTGRSRSMSAFIAATNKELMQAVKDAHSARILLPARRGPHTLPALRDRPEDIPLLATVFLRELCTPVRFSPKSFSAAVPSDLLRVLLAGQCPRAAPIW